MNKYKKWTTAEVVELAKLYNQKMSVKEMARMLNREIGSINKALDRFYIRKNRKPRPVVLNAMPKRKNYREAKVAPLKKGNWGVKIEAVICALQVMGFEVTPNASVQFPYKLNGHVKTAGQLLLECNRRRYAQRLPVYQLLDETKV